MRILAIESSCDETAAAVTQDGRRALSSAVASQIDAHKIYGGVVPEIASRMHVEAISAVAQEALREAGVTIQEIDAVAATYAPGLVGALLVGLNYAKGLAYANQKPLIAVHHLRSHVAANYLNSELEPPFISLIVSGGHTHIVEVRDYTAFRVVGRTRDDAAGEALDKTARLLGLPYPGGASLDKLGRNQCRNQESGNRNQVFQFPRPKVAGSPYDFSFSGLKTAAMNKIKELGIDPLDSASCTLLPDFAASFQYAVADYLCEKFLLAAKDLGYSTAALAGGVCANSVLRKEMQARCAAQGLALYMPALACCGENAAMVAAQAYYEFRAGNIAGLGCNAVPSLSVEE